MLFDTHCHTYLCKQKSEEEILLNIQNQNNLFITNVWVDLESSKHNIEVAWKYNFAYASVWVHPCDIWKYPNLDETINMLEKLAKNNKVVAIWECWLDYYRLKKEFENNKQCNVSKDLSECQNNVLNKNTVNSEEQKKQLQKDFFIAQIQLAKKLKLPLIIHNREAKNDIIEILKEINFKNFILHCFSEDLEFALTCLDFAPNCMISFSWILTFNSAKNIQETVTKIPLKNILIETDSPYLTPTPFRWQENYPNYVEYVFEKLCNLRTESKEKIENQVFKNSLDIFNIK